MKLNSTNANSINFIYQFFKEKYANQWIKPIAKFEKRTKKKMN